MAVFAPDLPPFHQKQGVVVELLGQTKNGPRIAVRIDGMCPPRGGGDLAFPPTVLRKTVEASAASSFAIGDRVMICTPELGAFDGKCATVVVLTGETKNGSPRVGVRVDGMPHSGEDELGFPPSKLVKVAPGQGGGGGSPRSGRRSPTSSARKEKWAELEAEGPEGAVGAVKAHPGKDAKLTGMARLSFTEDLGGAPVEDKNRRALTFFAVGERVSIRAPELTNFHGKKGVVVQLVGETKNGPRIAVRLDGAGAGGADIAFPPAVLWKDF